MARMIITFTFFAAAFFFFFVFPIILLLKINKGITIKEGERFVHIVKFYDDCFIEYTPYCVRKVDYADMTEVKRDKAGITIRYRIKNDIPSFNIFGLLQLFQCAVYYIRIPEDFQSELYYILMHWRGRRNDDAL